jgi:hypothetical protein
MPEWVSSRLPDDWSDRDLVVAGLVVTVATAVASLAGVAWAVTRIPADYFRGDEPPPLWADRHPLVRWPLRVLKNLVGVLLVALGAVLSVPGIPGQGVLTMLVGVTLLDFPGKRRAEKWVLGRRGVLAGINKLRARAGRPPLVLDTPPAGP